MTKKLILTVGALFFIATSMVSCKKDFTCKCSKTYTSGTGTNTNDYSVYTYTENRKRAEDRCNENVFHVTLLYIFNRYFSGCKVPNDRTAARCPKASRLPWQTEKAISWRRLLLDFCGHFPMRGGHIHVCLCSLLIEAYQGLGVRLQVVSLSPIVIAFCFILF